MGGLIFEWGDTPWGGGIGFDRVVFKKNCRMGAMAPPHTMGNPAPSQANTNPAIFTVPQALKNLASPLRQRKIMTIPI